MNDTQIEKLFQIPRRMLQRWKNSNDYRYLIYTFLKDSDQTDVEEFFGYMHTKSMSSKTNSKRNILHMHKIAFNEKVKEHIQDILNNKNFEEIQDLSELFNRNVRNTLNPKKEERVLAGLLFSNEFFFFAKNKNNDLVYFELINRIHTQTNLEKKITGYTKLFKDGYNLKKMIFFTNENKLPKFLRDKNGEIANIKIENMNIDDFALNYLDSKKIIFVPPSVNISKEYEISTNFRQ